MSCIAHQQCAKAIQSLLPNRCKINAVHESYTSPRVPVQTSSGILNRKADWNTQALIASAAVQKQKGRPAAVPTSTIG
jgi:hypothetical protein